MICKLLAVKEISPVPTRVYSRMALGRLEALLFVDSNHPPPLTLAYQLKTAPRKLLCDP